MFSGARCKYWEIPVSSPCTSFFIWRISNKRCLERKKNNETGCMGIRLCLNSGYLNTCSSPLLPSNAPCTCIDLSHVVLPRQILQDATCHLALRMSAEGLWWPTLEVMRMTLGSCKASYIYILYMIWIYIRYQHVYVKNKIDQLDLIFK